MTAQIFSSSALNPDTFWKQRVAEFSHTEKNKVLLDILRGLEKESLRVTHSAELSHELHPKALGAALTHPNITTDYSEALLEFITEPFKRVEDLQTQLADIHQYTYQVLRESDEMLWPSSMPAQLCSDEEIPVALYGNSHTGKMKTIYRIGLGHRYGRSMQTIAGIHYNFSLPDDFWKNLQVMADDKQSFSDFKTQSYFGLIRNFRREFWWLVYLFGASPAVGSCFVQNRAHKLQKFPHAKDTLYLPHATSLRMGDLGYQSDAQKALMVDYNQLNTYLRTLCGAITQSHPAYEAIGLKDAQGNYLQLNTSLLQIENEFYSSIRPKRTAKRGETALQALRLRGVEYVEVRCVDLNPFEPLGVSIQQMRVMDAFLLQAALYPSPITTAEEFIQIQQNQASIVNRGREPGLHLQRNGQDVSMQSWADEIYQRCLSAAELLDQAQGGDEYRKALVAQLPKLENPDLTPSAQVLKAMQEQGVGFIELTQQLAQQHSQTFAQASLSQDKLEHFQAMAQASIAQQTSLEREQTGSFEDYLAAYYEQYRGCQCASESRLASPFA